MEVIQIMRKSLLLGTLAIAAGAAHADPLLGLYAGVGAIHSTVDNVFDTRQSIENSEWKAFVGIKPLGSPLGFEAEYLDLGSRTFDFGRVSGDTWAFDAVGHVPLPLPFLTIYGKAGLSRLEVRGDVTSPFGPGRLRYSDQSSQFTYGAGVQVKFAGIGARLEYEHFNVSNSDGADVVTLGVLFSFL